MHFALMTFFFWHLHTWVTNYHSKLRYYTLYSYMVSHTILMVIAITIATIASVISDQFGNIKRESHENIFAILSMCCILMNQN